jgi:hypothetical protein
VVNVFRSFAIKTAPLLFVIAVASGCTRASAVDFSCPPTLQSTQSAQDAQEGWQAADTGAAAALQSAELLSGDPADNASQVPDDASKDAKIETIVWNLVPNPNEPLWISCTYTNTRLVLVKRIPETAKQCVATYDLLPNGNRLRLAGVRCS